MFAENCRHEGWPGDDENGGGANGDGANGDGGVDVWSREDL